MNMAKEEICECITSSRDKELLLISLDENKLSEENEIVKLRRKEEDIIMSNIIDMEKINNLERLVRLHEERRAEIRWLTHKIEDTRVC